MALIRCSTSSGGGYGSLKDIIRDKVFNGGFSTYYGFEPFSSRCTISEGRISVDTDNKIAYLYADFTMATTISSSDWAGFMNTTTQFPTTYTAESPGNSNLDYTPLMTDESSDTHKQMCFYRNYNSKSFLTTIKGTSYSSGEHYIVYGMWSYT